MENVSRRVISAILGLALSVGSVTPVYAASGAGSSDVTLQVDSGEGPSIVSIKVPTEIPLKMDKEGAVTVPQDLKITNFSDSTDVELKGLSVIGKNAWVVKDYSEDLSSKPEGTKELSMSFRGDGTTSQGSVSLSQGAWVVNKSSELPLNVSAKLPKQSSGYKEKGSIAQVDYTFAVKDEPTDPAKQFTVNYIAGENGSVGESSRSFSEGSPLTFPSATPSEGYVFEKWVDNATGLDVTGSTMVNGNMTVKAVFKADESQTPIESTISNNWSKDKVIKGSVTPVTINYDSTSPDTHIVSVVSGNAFVTVEKAPTGYSLGNPGSEVWNVKAVGSGSATVTATLNTGETTQFVVNVYEVNVSGGGDVTVDVPNVPDKGPGDNLETGDITIDIPIKNPDGSDGTITVTPTIPPDTTLEEGENTITGSVTIDNVTINITIVITVEGSGSSNPSDGLTMTVPEAQAMGFTFSPYQDGLQIDSFENKQFKSEVNVPEQIGDFKVRSIGKSAFNAQSNLTKITLPETVNRIDAFALYMCSGLKYLNIPASVKFIGDRALYSCGAEDGVLDIDSISIVEENYAENNSSHIMSCINWCGSTILLPDGLTHIGTYVFGGYYSKCRNLKNIVIPEGVVSIGAGAFYGASSLTSVSLPKSLTEIGDKAFGSSGLTAVVIPEGVTTIGTDAFAHSRQLSSVKLPNSLTEMGWNVFRECALTSVVIPEGVTTIEGGTFRDNRQLSSVELPKNLKTIGLMAFSGCSALSSVRIPDGVTSIDREAFYFVPHIEYHGSASGAPWGAKSMN